MSLLMAEDPCIHRRKNPSTDSDIIYAARRNDEFSHRIDKEKKYVSWPVVLPTVLPIQQLTLDHLQDCCNKATAIYCIDRDRHSPQTERPAYSGTNEILNVIYPQWFLVKGHNTDFEFGRFVAKMFKIDCRGKSLPKIETLLDIHAAVCDQVPAAGDILEKSPSFEEMLQLGKETSTRVFHNVDVEHCKFYKLRPLFQALIIVVDDPWQISQYIQVKLVRTGVTSGLSAPISFDSIEPEIKHRSEDGNTVTVNLRAAIKFVMELDERERRDRPDAEDAEGQEVKRADRLRTLRECRGYKGDDLKGPVSSWIRSRELEAVVVPITPSSQTYTLRMRDSTVYEHRGPVF